MGAFKLCKNGPCGISITGFEEYNSDEYEYNFEDYISVNVLYKIDSKGNSSLEDFSIDEHDNIDLDQTEMVFKQDGLYEVFHFVVSKSELNEIDDLWIQAKVAVADKEDSKLTFCYCRIQECYFKYASDFLEKYCASGKCSFKNTSIQFDVIYIGITVLRYLLDLGKLYEAQSVLDQLVSCSGVCREFNKINIISNGCGCC